MTARMQAKVGLGWPEGIVRRYFHQALAEKALPFIGIWPHSGDLHCPWMPVISMHRANARNAHECPSQFRSFR